MSYVLNKNTGGSGTGDVTGPGSSVAGNFASFADTSGSVIEDSGFDNNDFVLISGSTMTGTLVLNGNPTNANDAVNKAYADSISAGAIFKQVAVAASTVALTATYANGVSGVGATLTNAGALVAFALDSVVLNSLDRVLIKNQAAQAQNGIYQVTDQGSGATPWILTRTTDYDQSTEILAGTVIPIMSGTINSNTSWIQSNTVATVGTSAIFFTQYTYNSATFLQVANNLSDLNSASTARTNLGLGTAALLADPITSIHGGTGLVTYAIGDILYASGVNTLAKLAAGSNTQVLTLAGGVPTWATPATGTVASVSGTTNRISSTGGANPVIDIDGAYAGQSTITILGTVATGIWSATAIGPTKGGTGQTVYTIGDILYASSTTALSKLGVGSNTQVLTLAGGVPTWASPATGTVTSVSGTANRISSTGGATPVLDIDAAYAGQATITILGTVATGTWSATAIGATKGGTGQTGYTIGDILYASSTTALSKLGVGSNTQVLTLAGGVPTWASPATGTVTSVSGTANRISSTGGATPVLDIDAAYAGQSTITILGTVATGTWSATNIALNKGGTNAALTASNGGIFYSTASAGAILSGTATANKVLMSGATAAPVWSTPAFPNASATTRKIIVSDGTDWVASTETYAVPGTSGNVLTSNGTNWTSAAPASASAFFGSVQTQGVAGTSNPADSTTYYMINGQSMTTSTSSFACSNRFYAPVACTITKVYGAFKISGTLATTENCTLFLRKNDTTNTTVLGGIQLTSADVPVSVTGLSISLAAGDFLSFGFTCPAWATNPTGVGFAGTFST